MSGSFTTNSLFTYTTANGAITLTGYSGPGGALSIPSTLNGLPVTGIGANAFKAVGSLTSVTIPAGITSIGLRAFAACPNLTTIAVDGLNNSLSSMDGVLFDKLQTTLIQCPGGKAGSYAIPAGVTALEAMRLILVAA